MNIASERYGSNSEEYTIFDDSTVKLVTPQHQKESNKWNGAKNFIRSAFLPAGYPESVSEDYLEYQSWDTVQAFCSSITGLLATQAVLKGYGVGDEKATVAAATITWMLKDGMGMIGRILFAWMKGTQLDCDAKRWRLVADILNDLAILLDLMAPLFSPHLFIVIVCMSSVARSLVGVAGGATRAALTLHQARRDNMADVSAKDGSQETLVNLMALLAGFVITPLVSDNQPLVWVLFYVLTALHLFGNYRAVCCVVMETYNLPRLQLSVQHFLQTHQVLNPKQIAKFDPVLSRPGLFCSVRPGARLTDVTQSVIGVSARAKSSPAYMVGFNHRQRVINIAFSVDAQPSDIMRGCFHALLFDVLLKNHGRGKPVSTAFPDVNEFLESTTNLEMDGNLFLENRKMVDMLYVDFEEQARIQGWDLKVCHLGVDEWRFRWTLKKDQ